MINISVYMCVETTGGSVQVTLALKVSGCIETRQPKELITSSVWLGCRSGRESLMGIVLLVASGKFSFSFIHLLAAQMMSTLTGGPSNSQDSLSTLLLRRGSKSPEIVTISNSPLISNISKTKWMIVDYRKLQKHMHEMNNEWLPVVSCYLHY